MARGTPVEACGDHTSASNALEGAETMVELGGLQHFNLEEGLLLRHLSRHQACHQIAVELPTGILVGFHHGVR